MSFLLKRMVQHQKFQELLELLVLIVELFYDTWAGTLHQNKFITSSINTTKYI